MTTKPLNEEKLSLLFNRIVNNKTEENDQAKYKAYINEMFENGRPSQHQLQQFNNLVIREAQVLAQQKSYEVLNILADVERVATPSAFQYNIPTELEAKWLWSANGTSVEHVRIEGQRSRTLVPTKYSTGMYYELTSLVNADVEYFNLLVNKAADALVALKFDMISKLFRASVANGGIPTTNQLTGNNITYDQYAKFANRFRRFGTKPVFVADSELIEHFALQLPTNTTTAPLLYDDVKRELLSDLEVTQIGRTTAVNLVNPWILNTIGTANEQTQLPVNEGYMFAGGVGFKPLKLVEFGAPTQYTEFDSDLEQVQVKMTVELAADFVTGQAVGYIKDDAVTL